tara:strand:- start:541 stop:738 length:198 start_codon:yes stop_codon:yes gene_type:complete
MDNFFLKFFTFMDKIVDDMDKAMFPQPKKRKRKKCKNCHCKCHCKEELHTHWYDGDLCVCEGCQC